MGPGQADLGTRVLSSKSHAKSLPSPIEMPTPASWKPHSEKDEFLPPEDRAPLLPVEKEINWEST